LQQKGARGNDEVRDSNDDARTAIGRRLDALRQDPAGFQIVQKLAVHPIELAGNLGEPGRSRQPGDRGAGEQTGHKARELRRRDGLVGRFVETAGATESCAKASISQLEARSSFREVRIGRTGPSVSEVSTTWRVDSIRRSERSMASCRRRSGRIHANR
jgi:hypothetical protein